MTMATVVPEAGRRAEWLADVELRSSLERYVRRRLKEEDAGDVVQATIADALASEGAPAEPENFRRFVFVIARNKVADHYRRHSRELPDDQIGDGEPGAHDPVSARDLLRWAEETLPSSEDKNTLEWMLREADGDKLEHIAQEANVPAPRVRQRVSRLRKYLRARWAAQLAAAGMAGLALVLGALWYQRQQQQQEVTAENERSLEEGRRLRRGALAECEARRYQKCVDGLERARQLDPRGDGEVAVREARRVAAEALAPRAPTPQQPAPAPAPSPPSSASARPSPSSTVAPKIQPKGSLESDPVPQKKNAPLPPSKAGPKPDPTFFGQK
jgi:RNA polymerase sigma factor (sigma-70 family)